MRTADSVVRHIYNRVVRITDSSVVRPVYSSVVRPVYSSVVRTSDSSVVRPVYSSVVRTSDSSVVRPVYSSVVRTSDSLALCKLSPSEAVRAAGRGANRVSRPRETNREVHQTLLGLVHICPNISQSLDEPAATNRLGK